MYSFALLVVTIVAVGCLEASPMSFRTLNELSTSNRILENTLESERFLQSIYQSSDSTPDEVDWRKVPGRVTEIKDQINCNGAWAIAATGVLEGQEKLHANLTNDNIIPLSEQNLIDCVSENYGCVAGSITEAYDWIKQNGIEDEKSYPFQAKTGKCKFDKKKSVMTQKGYASLPQGDEHKLKEVVAKYGPVATKIDASSNSFQLYKQGVYYEESCGNETDEVNLDVLIIGYGVDTKEGDYWIVKNAWGTKWGDKGFIKMARNRQNNCGIATMPTIATF